MDVPQSKKGTEKRDGESVKQHGEGSSSKTSGRDRRTDRKIVSSKRPKTTKHSLGNRSGKRPKAVEKDSYATLGKLVSKATKPTRETGYRHVDDELLQRIKAVAKQDERCAAGALSYLMERMRASSAEVRFMALRIIGELFQRSKVVRATLVANLESFLHLSLGFDGAHPLPGPAPAANAMREKALELLERWNDSYSDLYKELRVAYRFLREGKRMKFPELQVRAARERSEATRREKNAERLLRVKYFQAKREIQDQISEMETMVQEMQGCYDILVPAVPGTDAVPIPPTQNSKRKVMFKGGFKRPRSSPPPSPDPRSDQKAAGRAREASGKGRASESTDEQGWGHVGGAPGHDGRGGDDGVFLRPPPRRIGVVAADGGPQQDNNRKTDGSGVEVRTESSQGSSSRAKRVEDGSNGNVGVVGDDGDDGDDDEEADGIEWEDGGDGNVDPDGSAKHQKSTSGASSLVTSDALASLRDDGEDEDDDEDDDDNIEWEDGEGGDACGGKDAEGLSEEERDNSMDEEGDGEDGGCSYEDDGDTGNRSREYRTSGRSLLSLADTVEAAGLGSRGYELQLEIPTRWSLSTYGASGEDTALVLSTLRERYKVLTSRVVPLLSDWIRTLSRVTFDEPSPPRGTPKRPSEHQGNMEQVSNQQDGEGKVPVSRPRQFEAPATTERSACAELLRRCLSTRNSVNTVVSKFLELKIDQDERRSDRSGSEKSRKGNGRSDTSSRSGSGSDKSTNAHNFRLEF